MFLKDKGCLDGNHPLLWLGYSKIRFLVVKKNHWHVLCVLYLLFFSPHFLLPFENKEVFTRLSVYSIYICKLFINYELHLYLKIITIIIFVNYYLLNISAIYIITIYPEIFVCVLFLTAMYFSVLYLTSTCFKKTSHSGILFCFRLCHICNFVSYKIIQ